LGDAWFAGVYITRLLLKLGVHSAWFHTMLQCSENVIGAGGGFFTGWKGISVGLAAVAGVGGLLATGYFGSINNTAILVKATSGNTGAVDYLMFPLLSPGGICEEQHL
jgi:hypothetical protein